MKTHAWTSKKIARAVAQALILGAALHQSGCIAGDQVRNAATSSITSFLNTLLTSAVSTAVNAAIGG